MIPSITDAELEIMKILWRENRPMLYTELRLELEDAKAWKPSTIQTLVGRLRDKGAIHSINDTPAQYVVDLQKEEYIRLQGQSFLDRVFDGSVKNLVATLFQSGQLSENDIDELREYLRREGENNG